MALFRTANNATSSILEEIDAVATTMSVAVGTGSKFPALDASDDYFVGTLSDKAGVVREIVKVTAMVGDEITAMERAQEGTLALAWPAGTRFQNLWTDGQVEALVQLEQLAAAIRAQATSTTIDTIADLPTLTRDYPVVILKGAFSIGDGGQGDLVLDPTSTATIDNRMVFATWSGVGRYLRPNFPFVYSAWFNLDLNDDEAFGEQNRVEGTAFLLAVKNAPLRFGQVQQGTSNFGNRPLFWTSDGTQFGSRIGAVTLQGTGMQGASVWHYMQFHVNNLPPELSHGIGFASSGSLTLRNMQFSGCTTLWNTDRANITEALFTASAKKLTCGPGANVAPLNLFNVTHCFIGRMDVTNGAAADLVTNIPQNMDGIRVSNTSDTLSWLHGTLSACVHPLITQPFVEIPAIPGSCTSGSVVTSGGVSTFFPGGTVTGFFQVNWTLLYPTANPNTRIMSRVMAGPVPAVPEQWIVAIPPDIITQPQDLSSLTWSAGTATATTLVPHGFPVGRQFSATISLVQPFGYNGNFAATATGASTFTYPLVADPGGAATVPGFYDYIGLSVVDVANAHIDGKGPTSNTGVCNVIEIGHLHCEQNQKEFWAKSGTVLRIRGGQWRVSEGAWNTYAYTTTPITVPVTVPATVNFVTQPGLASLVQATCSSGSISDGAGGVGNIFVEGGTAANPSGGVGAFSTNQCISGSTVPVGERITGPGPTKGTWFVSIPALVTNQVIVAAPLQVGAPMFVSGTTGGSGTQAGSGQRMEGFVTSYDNVTGACSFNVTVLGPRGGGPFMNWKIGDGSYSLYGAVRVGDSSPGGLNTNFDTVYIETQFSGPNGNYGTAVHFDKAQRPLSVRYSNMGPFCYRIVMGPLATGLDPASLNLNSGSVSYPALFQGGANQLITPPVFTTALKPGQQFVFDAFNGPVQIVKLNGANNFGSPQNWAPGQAITLIIQPTNTAGDHISGFNTRWHGATTLFTYADGSTGGTLSTTPATANMAIWQVMSVGGGTVLQVTQQTPAFVGT